MKDNKKSMFQKFLSGNNEDERAKKKLGPKLILLLLAVGIMLMFSGNLIPIKEEEVPVFNEQKSEEEQADVPTFASKNSSSSIVEQYEKEFAANLRDVLENTVGIKDVTVYVNLDSSEVKVLEKNTVTRTQSTDEIDREGGKRTVEDTQNEESIVIVREDNKETPVVIKVDKPDVRGVTVVAKGADNIQVKKLIVEAVTRYLDVPSHRVSVLPKKG